MDLSTGYSKDFNEKTYEENRDDHIESFMFCYGVDYNTAEEIMEVVQKRDRAIAVLNHQAEKDLGEVHRRHGYKYDDNGLPF